MSVLQHIPRFTAPQAVDLARTHYHLEAAAEPLASERDQNFLLATPAGKFVLKIANTTEPRALLEAQNAVLAHLASSVSFCPRVVPAASGDDIVRHSSGHFLRVLTWLPGVPVATVPHHSDALLRDIGRRMGELDRALAAFDHPAFHREFHWDLANAFAEIRPALSQMADPRWRDALQRETDLLQERLDGRLERLRKSIIHNDANDYNLLVQDDSASGGGQQVSGVIDFGDMVYSVRIADLAVAIAYAVLDKPDPVAAGVQVLRGYQAANSVEEDEAACLFDLVKLRLCLSAALAVTQGRERPADAYLTISQAALRRTLPRLIGTNRDFLQCAARSLIRVPAEAIGVPGEAHPVGSNLPGIERPHVGPSVRLAYKRPVHIVRGSMQYMFDAGGRQLLDAYNNVPHVGHCHPEVVLAAEQQLRLLNTNTRYQHDALERFASELASTLPDPLNVCYFVNSGSEANELALRLARAHTGRRDVMVLEYAYHGITTTLTDISPYKFDAPGGSGREPWVHIAPIPDRYRGRYRDDDPQAARKYADDAVAVLEAAQLRGRGLSAFIAETAPSVAGQLMLPPGYLQRVYHHVRSAGGLCIADEVQTAYGRIGTHFYAFEAHDVVPDIVVLGKPIGNGYPLGAVVTTAAIATSFDNGLEFFSTFGGSTVACVVGSAVLEVVRRERLQEHALRVGTRLIQGLQELREAHALIGDVRGSGLYLGVELVRDRSTREPAAAQADFVVNRLRERRILIGTDGPDHNVLKIRPPMPFDERDAETVLDALDGVLREAIEASLPAPNGRSYRQPGT